MVKHLEMDVRLPFIDAARTNLYGSTAAEALFLMWQRKVHRCHLMDDVSSLSARDVILLLASRVGSVAF